jgi:S1-C subfamily serine protease
MLRTLLASSVLAAGGAQAVSADKLYLAISPSVWRVFALNAEGKPFAQGSAVVVANETLLTNCHVLVKAKGIVIKQGNVNLVAKLQYADAERDLCQMAAPGLKAPALPLGDSDKLVVGQKIYTLGNPVGLELTLSDGLVSALRKDATQRLRYIQISAPISHGSSGGGLFDKDGKLVGITSAGVEGGQNLNLAIPIAWVKELPVRSAVTMGKYETDRRIAQPVPAPARPARTHATPVASGYGDIKDVAKVVQLSSRAQTAYETFLTKPFPRAFAIGEDNRWWYAAGWKPKDPGSDPDPAVRVVPDCEKHTHRTCVLYAVDDVVVYQDKPKRTAKAQETP